MRTHTHTCAGVESEKLKSKKVNVQKVIDYCLNTPCIHRREKETQKPVSVLYKEEFKGKKRRGREEARGSASRVWAWPIFVLTLGSWRKNTRKAFTFTDLLVAFGLGQIEPSSIERNLAIFSSLEAERKGSALVCCFYSRHFSLQGKPCRSETSVEYGAAHFW